jgi:hypothetical protein
MMQKIISAIRKLYYRVCAKDEFVVSFSNDISNAKDAAQQMVDSGKYKETQGKNRGPAIDALCKEFGYALGSAWCALFISKAFKTVEKQYSKGYKFPYGASSQGILKWFKKKGWTSQNPEDVLNWKGALLVRTNKPYDGHGHILMVKGRFVAHGKVAAVSSLEGNTDTGGSSNGDGAYERKRKIPFTPTDDEWTFCNTSYIKGGQWW